MRFMVLKMGMPHSEIVACFSSGLCLALGGRLCLLGASSPSSMGRRSSVASCSSLSGRQLLGSWQIGLLSGGSDLFVVVHSR
ncbi:unnamed protein product [Linum trigynum]|uniref:Secreted protein n=1 Tax=Linum trigynum TaxID=586398 RepID=A0AAV2G5Y1_9ROSI